MKKYAILLFLIFFSFNFYSLSFENSLSSEIGSNKQTGFKSTQLNINVIYNLMGNYFFIKSGFSFDAESFNFSTQISGQYEIFTKYFNIKADLGIFYHNLFFYDIFVDQDILLIGTITTGCPYTKTQFYASAYYGWKNTTIFSIADSFPELRETFTNYDFGFSQDICRVSIKSGISTYSFFRHDLRFIPELYLKSKVNILRPLFILADIKLQFSDISNKTCHPEYLFFTGGLEWHF